MLLYLAIHALIWSALVFYFIDILFELVLCSPREKIWNKLIITGHCFDANAVNIASGLFNVVSDFAMLVLPMAPIWKLQLPPKKKLLMIAIFATGVGFGGLLMSAIMLSLWVSGPGQK
ncbi:MAG: hypothetical protein Q9179_000356 [Wetmoreana sp. 5 TL-2023]